MDVLNSKNVKVAITQLSNVHQVENFSKNVKVAITQLCNVHQVENFTM